MDEITHTPEQQIPQQEQPPQIKQTAVPQIERKPHARTRKHVGIVLSIVAFAVWAFLVYRMVTLKDYSAIYIAVVVATFIAFCFCVQFAIGEHKKLIRKLTAENALERIGSDVAQEMKSIKTAKDIPALATPHGRMARKWAEFKEFVKECKRVWAITKKPNREEFKTIVKISGVGILLIGLIGFLIHFAREGLRALGF
jgi:protein transport protein SEC61 subunit gamma-like protein